jgi:hypothetical protein
MKISAVAATSLVTSSLLNSSINTRVSGSSIIIWEVVSLYMLDAIFSNKQLSVPILKSLKIV